MNSRSYLEPGVIANRVCYELNNKNYYATLDDCNTHKSHSVFGRHVYVKLSENIGGIVDPIALEKLHLEKLSCLARDLIIEECKNIIDPLSKIALHKACKVLNESVPTQLNIYIFTKHTQLVRGLYHDHDYTANFGLCMYYTTNFHDILIKQSLMDT